MFTARRLTTTLAGAMLAAALAAPGAGARPIDTRSGTSDVKPSTPDPTVTRTIDRGIDVGSAALGAGGATAVLMLTAAGAAAATHRRRHAEPSSERPVAKTA